MPSPAASCLRVSLGSRLEASGCTLLPQTQYLPDCDDGLCIGIGASPADIRSQWLGPWLWIRIGAKPSSELIAGHLEREAGGIKVHFPARD